MESFKTGVVLAVLLFGWVPAYSQEAAPVQTPLASQTSPEAQSPPSRPVAHENCQLGSHGEAGGAAVNIPEGLTASALRWEMHLYGNVDYVIQPQATVTNQFVLGGIDLFATAHWGEFLTAIAELQVEFGEDNEAGVDAERLLIGHRFSRGLNVMAGRFHTPVGYWLQTYHHGKHLYDGTSPPFFLDFEDDGGLAPAHTIGLLAGGEGNAGDSVFGYQLAVGNGEGLAMGATPGTATFVPLNAADNNSGKIAGTNLYVLPAPVQGLRLGTSFFYQRIMSDDPLRTVDAREYLAGADAMYEKGDLKLIAEYLAFIRSDEKASGKRSVSHGTYAQAAYQISDLFRPYARIERLWASSTDPVLIAMGVKDRTIVRGGLRFDLDEFYSSIRGEYRWDNRTGTKAEHVGVLQWTFGL